jgi:hypothetical protein
MLLDSFSRIALFCATFFPSNGWIAVFMRRREYYMCMYLQVTASMFFLNLLSTYNYVSSFNNGYALN